MAFVFAFTVDLLISSPLLEGSELLEMPKLITILQRE
jgi:hypothetical protein